MTLNSFILIAVATFALIHLIWCKNNFARIISVLQILAVGLSFIPDRSLNTASAVIIMLSLILIIAYSLFNAGLKTKKRAYIILIAALLLAYRFIKFQNYPDANLYSIAMIIPVLIYLGILFTEIKGYRNEHGFLAITAALSLLDFVNGLQNMIQM